MTNFMYRNGEGPSSEKVQKERVKIEVRRLDKWTQMLKNWPQWERSPKMVERVHKGIPSGVRRYVSVIDLFILIASSTPRRPGP